MDSTTLLAPTQNYVDIQGLSSLKSRLGSDDSGVKKEVAQQFEALMVQMMLKSMRTANEAFSDKEENTDAFGIYQDLFDKQVSLSVHGLGIAKQIQSFLDKTMPDAQTKSVTPPNQAILNSHKPMLSKPQSVFESAGDFVQKLLPHAKAAAAKLGVSSGVLVAQAALETNWGKSVVHQMGESTFNLFNIKADSSWHKSKAIVSSLEQEFRTLGFNLLLKFV